MAIDSIPARLLTSAAKYADRPAYWVRGTDSWEPTTWAVYAQEVQHAARALMALGLEPGQRICILGNNRPEWVIADLAAMMAGGVPAGIYQTCSAEEVGYIIEHSESPIVVVENTDQWAKLAEQRDRLPNLKHVIMMRNGGQVDDPLVLSWEAFEARAEEVDQAALDARMEALEDNDPATFIYTSGTTGPPKAVMLSHRNLAWTASVSRDVVETSSEDSSLSYLPLSHIAEQMFTIHNPVTVSGQIYYARSPETVADDLKEVQPTVIFGVPRVWEKFHAAVSAKLAAATGLKARLLRWARGVGMRMSLARNCGQPPGVLLSLQHRLASRLVFSKLKPLLGLGRSRFLVSGAAPIAPEILEFFASLDVVIQEVYGQSEDTGPTSFNLPGLTKFGTVGPPLPGVEVRIAEDGEIQVRGPNVFLGYYKDDAATAETLVDGWLCSGDLGSFDSDGFLSITGRKKDIIVTAGGKNIAPRNIEAALTNLELISQAVVIGDRRKFLSAVLTLDPEAAGRFADAQGLAADKVHESPELRAAVQAGVDEVSTQFARVEHVRKFEILPRELSQDHDELTPTMKIKRRVVAENWAELIDAMYKEATD